MDEYTIYDYVLVTTLDIGDCIFWDEDYIELTSVVDEGDVLVVGYSHVSGDTVTYVFDPNSEVGLWTV